MEGSELKEQSNAIDISEKEVSVKTSRKIDLMIFYLADAIDVLKETKCDVDELKTTKNKVIGAVSISSLIGGALVWLIDKFLK